MSSTSDPAALYAGLRDQVLALDPAAAGLSAPFSPTGSWGCVMDTGYPGASVTLVGLSDGTTSLYTSSGFGIIGGGGHEAVVRATLVLLSVLDQHLGEMTPSHENALPAEGRTVIRALTTDGPRVFEASEDDLGNYRSVLSPVFHAAQAVISELRAIDEAR
ncbi:MAG: hypothetical protein JWP74_3806 [Marmoricola sp.]|nr:hypothetical protein [Marmoricola sp.]